jgi:2-keto-4-pentenoate hydratase/2-oxohepta-3-ene-1,7-dioic acid hydratase in catechol pathway
MRQRRVAGERHGVFQGKYAIKIEATSLFHSIEWGDEDGPSTMKLVRYGNPAQEKPGLLDANGRIRDLSGHIQEVGGETLAPAVLARLGKLDPASLPIISGSSRLGPCVGQVSKIVGVGLNYATHAAETGHEAPKEPILFLKSTTSLAGANDPIRLPRGSQKTDWEIELGVVVGTTARYVRTEDALSYVAGYCTLNDVSERAFQNERGGQFTKGKSPDTFGPIGPWLVTADEVRDPQALDLFCEINGDMRQQSNTRDMMMPVARIISYVTEFMTLLPGDVIATGTPSGVGWGMKPPVFLKAGDRVRCAVAGLGEQLHDIIAW